MTDLGRGPRRRSTPTRSTTQVGFEPPTRRPRRRPTTGQTRRQPRGPRRGARSSSSELTERLRRDCPWDREQTARTIVPHTVEEAYEVADAALAGDAAKLLDELGDLLFQTYFLALLLEERGAGDLEAASRGVHDEARPPAPARVRRRGGRRRRRACASRWEELKTRAGGARGHLPRRARERSRRCSSAQGAAPRGGRRLRVARRRRARSPTSTRSSRELRGGAGRAGEPQPETEPDAARVRASSATCSSPSVNVARRLNVDPELALRATTASASSRASSGRRAARRGRTAR